MDSSEQVKRYVDIAWRRKWWIIVPAGVALAASIGLVAMMPRVYRATTSILVIRQSVPENIVRSTITQHIEERVRNLELQVFSRSYLEQIVHEFELVPVDAHAAEIEDACRTLGEHIFPEFDRRDYSWFRISVEDVDPKRAAGIANRLASLFIEQNARMRASQAAGALAATENWESKYGLELAKRDQAILQFRQQFTDELPDQQPANFQLLSSAQGMVEELTGDIQSHSDRVFELRRQQKVQHSIEAASGSPGGVADDDARLAALERELSGLLGTYTEANPLVRRQRGRIAELVQSRFIADASRADTNLATTPRLDPLAAQIAKMDVEIKRLEDARVGENAKIATYRARIGNASQRQQKLQELTRDYDESKHQFDTAAAQTEQAQHSQDLEATTNGERFQIQDRAYPPAIPFKPGWFRLIAMGIAVGLALGGGAVTAREFVDQTVRGEDEFAALFPDLPICGVIPSLDTNRAAGAFTHARR